MNQNIARDIRNYIKEQIPKAQYDVLQPKMYRWMKRYWKEGLSHKERGKVHKIMKQNKSLPKSWDKYAKKIK